MKAAVAEGGTEEEQQQRAKTALEASINDKNAEILSCQKEIKRLSDEIGAMQMGMGHRHMVELRQKIIEMRMELPDISAEERKELVSQYK